jgi:hypothetical protein
LAIIVQTSVLIDPQNVQRLAVRVNARPVAHRAKLRLFGFECQL